MRYAFAHRTKRIVFLVALLFPTAALAYIAIPHGTGALRNVEATARTQDIPIDAQAAVGGRMTFIPGPDSYVSRGATLRSAADERAITELGLAASAHGDGSASSGRREGSQSRGAASVSGRSPRASRGSGSSASFGGSGGGMSGAGGWGGVSGTAQQRGQGGEGRVSQVAARTTAQQSSNSRSSRSGSNGSSGGSGSSGSSGPSVDTGAPSTGSSAITIAAVPVPVFSSAVAPVIGASATPAAAPAPSATPEPMTFMLVGGGLAAVFGARRRIRG